MYAYPFFIILRQFRVIVGRIVAAITPRFFKDRHFDTFFQCLIKTFSLISSTFQFTKVTSDDHKCLQGYHSCLVLLKHQPHFNDILILLFCQHNCICLLHNCLPVHAFGLLRRLKHKPINSYFFVAAL